MQLDYKGMGGLKPSRIGEIGILVLDVDVYLHMHRRCVGPQMHLHQG